MRNACRHLIVAVALLAVAPPLGATPLSNTDIVRLVTAEFATSTIIEKIRTAACAFALDTDALIALKEAGVPDAIITAMLETATRPAPKALEPPAPAPSPTPPRFQQFTIENASKGRLFSRAGFVRFSADGVTFYTRAKPLPDMPQPYRKVPHWSHPWTAITRVCLDGKVRLNTKLFLRSGSVRLFDIGDFHDWAGARSLIIDNLNQQQRAGVPELQHVTFDYNCDTWKH